GVRSSRSIRGGLHQPCSQKASDGNVLTRLGFLDGVTTPALKCIDPRLDRIKIRSQAVHAKLPLPTVILEWTHHRLIPYAFPFRPAQNYGIQNVMPVGVNVRLNHDPFSHGPFNGIFSAINFRL